MNIYHYLFYRFYKRQRTKYGKIESSIVSILGITCLVFLNLITIETYLNINDIIPIIINSPSSVIISITIIFLVNCLIFLTKKRYDKIEQKFMTLNKKQNKIGTFIIILYTIISFILFVLVVNIK